MRRYNRGMAQWLVKEEPDHYGYASSSAIGRRSGPACRNPLAQKHLRGDPAAATVIFYYHTGKEKAIVAVAKAASDAYPDPEDASGTCSSWTWCRTAALARPVTLEEIKADASFATFPLVRIARLSVMPVTDAEWTRIESMAKQGG